MTSEVSTATLLTSKENLPRAGRPTENGIKHETTSLQGQLEFSAWISLHAERTRKTSKRNEWKNQICLWFCTAICIAAARQRLSFESKALLLKAFELFKTKPSKNMRCSQALVPLQLAPYSGWLRRDFRWVFGFFVEVKICTVRLGLAPRDHPEALQKRILLQWCQRPLTHESTYIFQFFSDVKVTLAEALKLLVNFALYSKVLLKEERGNGYWWIILKCESSKLPQKKIHLSLILLNSKRQKSWLRSSQPAMCSITVDEMRAIWAMNMWEFSWTFYWSCQKSSWIVGSSKHHGIFHKYI